MHENDILLHPVCLPSALTPAVHATRELCRRDWRYHKEMGRWFTFERGSYFYFDTAAFEKRGLQDTAVARNLSQVRLSETRCICRRLCSMLSTLRQAEAHDHGLNHWH